MGERTPHLDPSARGTLTGLAASHTRAHVTRAVLEGVAFSLKDTFSLFAEMQVPVRNIRLGGGGARSQLWRQIQADVYEHEVEILAAEEGAAYGAALLAGVGARFIIASKITPGVSPRNGGTPVAISYSTAPKENRSVRVSSSLPLTCSGDM